MEKKLLPADREHAQDPYLLDVLAALGGFVVVLPSLVWEMQQLSLVQEMQSY